MNKKLASILVLVSIIVVATAGVGYAVTVKDVGKEIKMVGCEMLVSVCQTDGAQQMRDEISAMIDKGMTKQEIIDSFIEKYGEQVYAAPTKKGFNLVAWIMPFLALIIGGGFIYYFARKWTVSYNTSAGSEVVDEEEISQEEEEEIEEELKKYL